MDTIWQSQTTYIWIVLIAAAIIWLIIRVSRRMPSWLREVILYLNMTSTEIGEATINYSQFLSKWEDIKWNFAYTGREKGQEITLGNFSVDDRYFYYFAYKTTVKPMLITDTDDQFDAPITETLIHDKKNYHVFSKEKFIIEKIKDNPEFMINLTNIFPGRHNWLEFTDLNQVILVTDYDFDDHAKMLNLIANFVQIKEKL